MNEEIYHEVIQISNDDEPIKELEGEQVEELVVIDPPFPVRDMP